MQKRIQISDDKMQNETKRVAVGLSGGVDSSVAAALLIEQGYDVTGVYLTCWSGPGCRSEEDRKDALDVALQLGIPFEHLDFQDAYREKVYEYMVREYEAGRTPNPDVVCNREIKFGLFYDWALRQAQGKLPRFDFVATGHYARIGYCDNQQFDLDVLDLPRRSLGDRCARQSRTCCLLRSVDERKDQTYFLYQLREEQLGHILFPIGHLTKREVRAEAEKRGLLTAKKPDSVGICFIGEVPMKEFLEKRIEPKEGEEKLSEVSPQFFDFAGPHLRQAQVADATQKKAVATSLVASPQKKAASTATVGKHRGVWFYTIGQKVPVTNAAALQAAGFDTTNLPHFYVVGKDVEQNVLYVGTGEQLYKDEVTIGETTWRCDDVATSSMDLSLRIRHTGELIPIKKLVPRADTLVVYLEKPVRGVAPGQAAVVYEGEVCVGGGVIQ